MTSDTIRCRYHRYGCDFVREAWSHENECLYRPVECPDLRCLEMVPVKYILVHIKKNHPFALWLGKLDDGDVSRQFWNIQSTTNFAPSAHTWVLTIWEYDGKYFISVFTREDSGHWYSWVYILANRHVSWKYQYDIRIANPGRGSSHSYAGVVHPIDERGSRIRKASKCFVLTDSIVKHYMQAATDKRQKEGYDFSLPIEYRVARI